MWPDIIYTRNDELSYYGTNEVKHYEHVTEVMKGIIAFESRPLMLKNIAVEVCIYRYYVERSDVESFCALWEEKLPSWRGLYMVHKDANFCIRAILPKPFRFMNSKYVPIWAKQARWELRTLLVMKRFVPHHLCCAYGLRE